MAPCFCYTTFNDAPVVQGPHEKRGPVVHPAQVPFWTARQFKPLIVAIVLPLMHVPSYTGPWLVRGTNEGERAEQALLRGFKGKGETHDAGKLHELDGNMCEVWEDAESRSRIVLQQFLAWASNFSPCRNVWCGECYQEESNDHFPRLDDNGEGQNTTNLEIEVSPTLNRYCCGRNGDHLMGVPF